MTLHPHQYIPEVPESTAKAARAAFRKGNRYMQMRDELGTLFVDEQFKDLFPAVGQTGIAPWRLALVTVMQYAENLSDRQAAEAVRGRIDWKYALSLDLSDEGFDFSVLSEFRTRLIENQAENRLLDIMLNELVKRELVKSGGKQRTDSTIILGKVRDLNRLELVGEVLRVTLEELAEVAPEWLEPILLPGWVKLYSQPFNEWRLPQKAAERQALREQIGRDGQYLLEQVYAPPTPLAVRELASVEFLRRTWVCQYWQEEEQLRWREDDNLPPASHSTHSPHDHDAQYSRKRDQGWVGYKAHLTETCDPHQPRFITHVETTPATQPDVGVVELIHHDLSGKALLPAQHLVDTGYVSAQQLVSSQQWGVDLVGPPLSQASWQTRQPGGLALDQFDIDFVQHRAICPQGQFSTHWKAGTDHAGQPNIVIRFPEKVCQICPVRQHCTKSSRGRQLYVQAELEFLALHAARRRQHSPEFKTLYRLRAGVEATLSHAVHDFGLRQARYCGLAKVHLQTVFTAVAFNLVRLLTWLARPKPTPPRRSKLTQFVQVGAS
jgi:transposase